MVASDMPGLDIRYAGDKPEGPPPTAATPFVGRALWRGMLSTCPRCGRGGLYRRYLKLSENCPSCGEPLGRIRADDFPPYLTIVVVGHIIVPLILVAEKLLEPPTWQHMVVWPTVTMALVLGLLPPIKGMVVGLMWHLKLKGDEFQ